MGINTGSFVKELRATEHGNFAKSLGSAVEAQWSSVTRIARVGLRAAQIVPRVSNFTSRAAAAALPKGLFPVWNESVRSDGFSRSALSSRESNLSYLPSCMNEIFGERELEHFLELSAQLGYPLEIPKASQHFCCGTPFSSKGLTSAASSRESRNKELLNQITHERILIDGSSCHQTLMEQDPNRVMELGQFVALKMLGTPVKNKFPRLVLHPTCSGAKTGANAAMTEIARVIAEEVIVPSDWRCCGFAGDRGLLIPELTRNATRLEAEEVALLDAVFVSNNQPCQIGMSASTYKSYRSILSAWLEAVT